MKVEVLAAGRLLQLRFAADADDPVAVEGRPQLARDRMTARVPEGYTTERVHPDVLGLMALLCVRPWISSRLDLSWGVSTNFASAVERSLKIAINRVDPDLRPRTAPTESVPALAFSGGVDSMAAAEVMPRGTILYFNERTNPPDAQRSLYDMSAALHTCEAMAKLGHRVRRVQCDVEYLRSPLGVPVDLANAIPALLLADSDGIDALGWGTIAESAYRIGSHGFIDYAKRNVLLKWRAVFAAIAIDTLNPVAGVSEVGTSLIARMAPGGDLAQSCIRGGPGKPCERCWKCVRKRLLAAALSGRWPTERWMASSLAAKEPMWFLTQIPIKHECVLTFAMAKYSGDHPALVALRRRVRADRLSADWFLRHYSPALDLVPGRYRVEVQSRLERYLRPMSAIDEVQFRDWSLAEVETTDLYRDLSQGFASEVAKLRARAESIGFLHKLTEFLKQLLRPKRPVIPPERRNR